MTKVDLKNILNSKSRTAQKRLEELKDLGAIGTFRVHGEESFRFPRDDWRIEKVFDDGVEAVDNSHEQTALVYCATLNLSFQYWLD